MVRPGNGSFTGKPTVFTRFWLGIHREFWKIPGRRRAPTIRSNAIVGIHSRPALKSALSAGKNRCPSSLPPPSVCFRPCFYSSPSRRRRVAVFPPVNKSRSHPPPPPPLLLLLLLSFCEIFLFFFFLIRYFPLFFHSSRCVPLCNSIVAIVYRDSIRDKFCKNIK